MIIIWYIDYELVIFYLLIIILDLFIQRHHSDHTNLTNKNLWTVSTGLEKGTSDNGSPSLYSVSELCEGRRRSFLNFKSDQTLLFYSSFWHYHYLILFYSSVWHYHCLILFTAAFDTATAWFFFTAAFDTNYDYLILFYSSVWHYDYWIRFSQGRCYRFEPLNK